jgi:hypothetical protein
MDPAAWTVLVIVVLVTPALILRYTLLGEWIEAIAATFVGWIVIAIVGCIYMAISSTSSPDLVTLKKGEWSCIHSHIEYRLVGKILVPADVCDTYQSVNAR